MWHETMTSTERLSAVAAGMRPDRVPVVPMSMGHPAVVCGQPLASMYEDPARSFRCQLLCQELYGYDGGPVYEYAGEGAWEFGGEMEFPHKQYSAGPTVTRHPVQTEEDVLALEVPEDVSKAGCLPLALQMARLQAAQGMPVTVKIGSPFSFAGSVIGEGRMMVWMIKKPELVHRVLEKVSDFLTKKAEYYAGEFGVENLSVLHGAHMEANTLISPKQFESFALPYLAKVNERVMELGVSSFFIHMCGEHIGNLPYWQRLPLPGRTILSFGREVPLQTAMEMFPNHIIAGNVDPVLIQEGEPEEVFEQARECIETAKYHAGGYVLMGGCDVPPHSPPVNVFQLVKAAREFGRY